MWRNIMVNITLLIPQIISKLSILKPDKIILFGSYAYGKPNENSDIDLFLVKDDLKEDALDAYEIEAKIKLLDLISQYKIGFDILSASSQFLNSRDDHFYKVDILQNGKVIYE